MKLEAADHLDEYPAPGDTVDDGNDANILPVVFISLDRDSARAAETAELLRSASGSTLRIVFASHEMDTGFVRKILLGGRDTLLPLPASVVEIQALIARVGAASYQSHGAPQGKLILFLGINGGAGTTTLVTHAARLLAEDGRRTLVIDGRRMLGHAGLYMGITRSRGSIWDLVENQARLDDSLLDGFVVHHESGLDLIGTLDKAVEGAPLSREAMTKVLGWLAARYEFIFVDAAANEDAAPAFAAVADQVLLIASAEIAPLRDLTRWADFYGRSGDKFQAVVSHLGRSPITARHIEETAQIAVAAELAEMNGSISSAINAGKPVESRVKQFYRAVDQILSLVAPDRASEPEQRKTSWLPWARRTGGND